jgi:hypothetical protein
MLVYIAPLDITDEHMRLLTQSLNAAVAFDRISSGVVMDKILKSTAIMFSFGDGIIVIEKRVGADSTSRLSIIAIAGEDFGLKIKSIIKDLKAIAAEWACDKIETMCYNPRLVAAIVKTGSKIESYNLVLEVD